MPETLTIWSNAQLPEEALNRLRAGVAPHRLILAKNHAYNLAAGEHDPGLDAADIAYGQPDATQIQSLPKLKWIHITSAGYTRYDNAACKAALRSRDAMLTNSSSVYDEPCAEHLLAMMMALARGLPDAWRAQAGERSWDSHGIRARRALLTGQSGLILGFGAIARRLVELLAPFGMNLIGVRRTVRGDEPIPVVTTDQTNRLLPQADHVINILPSAAGNEKFINAERLGLMKPTALLYNVGRGDTVDQDALLSALRSGRIAGAYLDVTTPEPLPPDHPLWTAPNCHITPHAAGGFDGEFNALVDHFLTNLHRYTTGQPLQDRII